MATVRYKISKNDVALRDMFNQIVGVGEPNLHIAIPKYDELRKLANNTLAVLRAFVNSPIITMLELNYEQGIEDILKFIKEAEEELLATDIPVSDITFTGADLNKLNTKRAQLQEAIATMDLKYKPSEFLPAYKRLKESKIIASIVVAGSTLAALLREEKERSGSETHDLTDKTALRAGFINNTVGDYLTIFDFSTLDFKFVMNHETATDETRKYVLFVLFIIYQNSNRIAELLRTPDIDIDEFSVVFIDKIKDLKRSIPRCDVAFKKIENSVDLLKGNFGNYYKAFVTTGNPSAIVTTFIDDVAAQQKDIDREATRQFRQIMRHFTSNYQAKMSDPNIRSMMSMMNHCIDILDGDQPATPVGTAEREGSGDPSVSE